MGDTDTKNSYGHVLKYTGIFGGVQGLNIFVGLVRNKFAALLLGPAGIGLVSLLNSTINFVSQATNLGLSFSAVKHVSEIFDGGDSERIAHFVGIVRLWCLVTAVAGIVLCAALGPLIGNMVFGYGEDWLSFVLLAPVVGMIAVTGGETAILKGARKLRALATIQVGCVLASLVISVPVYFFFGLSGIVPVLLLVALADMVLTVRYSFRLFPPKLHGGWAMLAEGRPMVRLGVAFVLTGVVGSGAEILIRYFLNAQAGLDAVGFYSAGYALTVTYAGMVFTAMETDFFPRLSAVHNDTDASNATVNLQMEVSLLIVAPLLALLILALPLLTPLLYSKSFTPVTAMAQVAALSMYFKALSLPLAYMTLAHGHSLAYFALETAYDLVLVGLIVIGYNQWGLFGTGVALTMAYMFDLIMVFAYAHMRYRYRISSQVFKYAALQLPLGAAAYAVTKVSSTWLYLSLGSVVVAVSVAFSIYILYKKTAVWEKLTNKLRRNG